MKYKIKLPKGWELKKLESGVYEVIQKTERLEIGKDYIHVLGDYLVINRCGDEDNLGIIDNGFSTEIYCWSVFEWREAKKGQVIEFFEKHLIERYGEDWKNVKVKDSICEYDDYTNEGIYDVDIHKHNGVWKVWNKNGCLFNGKEWAEVLEEKKVATDLSEIDRHYFINPWGKSIYDHDRSIQPKNHMTSKELCEGILALQQLISFRDDFHKVHEREKYSSDGAIHLTNEYMDVFEFEAIDTSLGRHAVYLFEFDTYAQAKLFLETHKDLFEELKKLY